MILISYVFAKVDLSTKCTSRTSRTNLPDSTCSRSILPLILNPIFQTGLYSRRKYKTYVKDLYRVNCDTSPIAPPSAERRIVASEVDGHVQVSPLVYPSQDWEALGELTVFDKIEIGTTCYLNGYTASCSKRK